MDSFDVILLTRQLKNLKDCMNPFVNILENGHSISAYSSTLENDWENFYDKRIKKKRQGDSRRQLKRLSEMGDLVFDSDCVRTTKQIVIGKMIEHKRNRYLQTKSTDFLYKKENRDFYYGITKIEDTSSLKFHYSSLILNDDLISVHFGMVWNNKFYYLMPANDTKNYQFSSGRLLLEHLLKISCQKGFSIFDFTVGAEEYKKSWCDIEILLFDHISAKTFRGFFYVKYHRFYARMVKNKIIKMLIKEIRAIIYKLF